MRLDWSAIQRQMRKDMKQVQIPVDQIREADEYRDGAGWSAIEDAETLGSGEVSVRIRHADGGIADRIWDNAAHEIVVWRA